MGNSSNATYGRNPTLDAKLIDSQPGLQLYQNAQGEQFEQYLVPTNSNHLDISYQFRINNQHPQLVDVLYSGQKASVINCTSPIMIQVVTERMPYRLAHLPPQQLQNAVTLLRSSLMGFKDLFKVNGLICVKDTMIGVSAKNKVKVWLNPVFAVNSPEPKPVALRNLDPACHEREMINNIFDLINSKADSNTIWRQLLHSRQKRNLQTFEEALTLVNEFIATHKLNINDELRNPFNKNIFGPKEQNSEIDKLQELKFNQRGVQRLEEERDQYDANSPTFQRITNLGQHAEKKANFGFAQLKNKCINTGNIKAQEISQSHHLHLVPYSQNIEKKSPEFKMPFSEIQKNMKLITLDQANRTSNSQNSQSQTIIHRHAKFARVPVQIIKQVNSRYLSQSPRQVHSLSKKIAVKFHYPNQTPGTTQSINLGYNQSSPPNAPLLISHQIIRSASEPKPICVRQITNPQRQTNFYKENLDNKNDSIIALANFQQQNILRKEQPMSFSQIPLNETANLVKQPQSDKKRDEQLKREQNEQQNNQINQKENLQSETSQNPAPHPNPQKIKNQVHEAPSYEIRVHEDTGSASQKEESSVLQYQRSPDATPSPKRQVSLSLTPEVESAFPENQLFKQIARLADRPFKIVNQPTNVRQQYDISKIANDNKYSVRNLQGSKHENSMTDSKELKKSQGSPRNDSGMGSSIMGRNKLPKVSYKEMRKMLLQTLQEY